MKKGNLLIVDDEILLLRPLRMLLSPLADNVFEASHGVGALEIISKEIIHCVLCDIQMPKMTGVELIKILREKGNNVPFIFYTGHGNLTLMMEAAKYGAFDFLNKPSLDGLEEVIEKGLIIGITPHKVETILDHLSEYQKMLNDIEEDT